MSEFKETALTLLGVALLLKTTPLLLFLILEISSNKMCKVANIITTTIAFLLTSTAITMWIFSIIQHILVIYVCVIISGYIMAYCWIKLEKHIKNER